MTGYVRVDTGNNIADGNVISAADLDNEFDGIQAAFNASTGHNHDGTTGEGAPILVLGPTQDVVVGASTVTPKTTNTVDIGSSSLKFKDLYMAGNASIGGTLAVTGVATLTAQPILSSLTASRAVFTDGSKGLVSNAITGTGNVVMSASPTLTGTITAEALTTSSTVTLNGGTANGVAYLNGSKVLTTGSALTFNGSTFGVNFASASNYKFYVSRGGTAGELAAFTDGTAQTLTIDTAASSILLNSANGGALAFGVTTEQMRLTSTGLGIGTSSPSSAYSGAARVAMVAATSTNAASLRVSSANASAELYSAGSSTEWGLYSASNSPFKIWTNNNVAATLDSSGNLGLGVTPSAGDVYYRKFELGKVGCGLAAATTALTSSELTYFTGNAVVTYTGGNPWIYGNAGGAGIYGIEDGIHKWSVAASGTAGNAISFTQAMTLDASGNLMVAATSPIYASTNRGNITLGGSAGSLLFLGTGGTTGTYLLHTQASGTFEMWNGANGPMLFATNNTERARIDSSGNLLVGTTSLVATERGIFRKDIANIAFVVQNEFGSGSQTIRSKMDSGANNTSSYHFVGTSGGLGVGPTDVIFIYGNGNVVNTNNSYGALSDIKLKENVVNATPKLEKLQQVRVVNYNLIGQEQKQLGVVAQELEQIFPGMIDETPDRDADGNDLGTTTKSVKYSVFVPMLIKAIQEQQALINQLKARLDAANL